MDCSAHGLVPRPSFVAIRVFVPALSAMLTFLLLGVAGVAPADRNAGWAGAARGIGERTVGWDTYRRLDRLPYLRADTQSLGVVQLRSKRRQLRHLHR